MSVAGVLWLAFTARGEPARALPDYPVTARLRHGDVHRRVARALAGEPRRLGRWTPKATPHSAKWIAGGLFIGNAYGLVIYTMQFIPTAYAVAFTNAGLIAVIAFGERQRWRSRLAAMRLICLGLAALSRA